MNKTIIGAFLIIFIVVVGAVGVKLVLPLLEESEQKATSDAIKTKGKIHLALDNWIGYFIINSPEMDNAMRRAGYTLVCEDDNADYDQRMNRLKSGEIDLAVATVDSFLLNAAKYNFPGAIVMVIDESKGGDAILARKSKVSTLDSLKGRTDIRVAFTPNSPSHHMAKAAADHFNVPELLPSGNLRIETDGSQRAMKKLLAGQADVAICWEPDVSRALADQGIVKILGTEDTEQLIVDILVANREVLKDRPEVIQVFVDNYFRVLKKYRTNSKLLIEHIKEHTGLDKSVVESMLKGVHWVNFNENCEKWYGIAAPGQYADEGLVDTIMTSVRILVNAGDFDTSPIPHDDPYRLTFSGYLEEIFARGFSGFSQPRAGGGHQSIISLEARFSPLDDAGWNALKAVGTLKVEPIVFQQGTTELGLIAKKVVDQTVDRLKHYPNFRVLINGHTGVRGDSSQNKLLSMDRADAVARYLQVVYNVDPNRLRVVGHGGSKPLPKQPGESRRAWLYRLPRVELVLAREDFQDHRLKKKKSRSKKSKQKPDVVQPPRPDEYLPATIQKAVINIGVKHPLTIYPLALGISCGVVGWLFQISNLYLAALGLTLSGPIWAVGQIFFRNESLGSSYLKALNRKQRNYERYLKAHLAAEFEECSQIEGLEDYASQGMDQLKIIQIKYANVKELLEMKLNTGEITFGRFLGAAEQVTLSVLDNLKRAVGILKSAASIQPEYIKERLRTIGQKQARSPEEEDQAKALEKRLVLWDEQLAKVNRLVASNEEAMTEMEKISAAIAEWRTDDSFTNTDFESALARLQALATSAHEYKEL